MEGYKSLKEAVISVENVTERWKNVASGELFDKSELLNMGETYDKLFEPDGWNYFVTFPTGEIGLLSTNDNEIMLFFVPEGAASTAPQAGAKPGPKFCTNCGAALNPGAKFCTECGTRVYSGGSA